MTTKPILVCDRVRVKQDVPCAYSGKTGQVVERSMKSSHVRVLFDDDVSQDNANRSIFAFAKTVPLDLLELEA